jgi:hypothetical protein
MVGKYSIIEYWKFDKDVGMKKYDVQLEYTI